MFLALALGWAEVLGARDIFIGVNARDYSGYPDCRPAFIAAFEALASVATAAGVGGTRYVVHTPLIQMTKAQIITTGLAPRPRLRVDAQLLRPAAGRPALPPLRQLRAAGGRIRGGRRRGPLARTMTERLYYLDAETLEFDARVTETVNAGGQPGVVLDRTAFYPTSGGQPFDTGRLGDARVLDVVDEGERIVHVLSTAARAGRLVHGVDRRGAAARPHAAAHRAAHPLGGLRSAVRATRPSAFTWERRRARSTWPGPLSAADVERAVDEANRVVWEDRPVVVRFASADEARAAGLRKESQREGELRLVEVADFDLSACGGTHVARTGAIGIIAVTGTEKDQRRAARVLRLRPARARPACVCCATRSSGSLRALSVLPAELPDAIRRLQADGKALRKRAGELQVALAGQEADRLLALASRRRAGRDCGGRHGRMGRGRPARDGVEPHRPRPGSGRAGDRRRARVDRRWRNLGHRCLRGWHRGSH